MCDISVIIPVYNDPRGLRETLESLVRQEQDGFSFEILPVDNNSNDETPIVIEEFERKSDLVKGCKQEQIQTSYATRNEGINQAKGDILVFIDADMTCNRYFLFNLNQYFNRTDCDYLGYNVEIIGKERTFWAWYDRQLALPTKFYFDRKQFVPTSALAVRKSVFDLIGGFIPTLKSSGDKEFGIRCFNNPHIKPCYTDTIEVYHPPRATFKQQMSKALRIGSGIYTLHKLGIEDEEESMLPIPDWILPPHPMTVKEKSSNSNPLTFPVLYLADCIISYLQVFGAILEYFNQ